MCRKHKNNDTRIIIAAALALGAVFLFVSLQMLETLNNLIGGL